jgi:hypothetical protein
MGLVTAGVAVASFREHAFFAKRWLAERYRHRTLRRVLWDA